VAIKDDKGNSGFGAKLETAIAFNSSKIVVIPKKQVRFLIRYGSYN